MNAIPISTLKPSDAEIDEARTFHRNEFAKGCELSDICEALSNLLTDEEEAALVELVKHARLSGYSPFTNASIGTFVVAAFRRYAEKWSESDLNSYLDGYADRQAEELRERGVLVDCAA